MKTLLSTLAVAGVTLLALGSIPASAQETKPAPVKTAPASKNPVVLMKTSMGEITIELFVDECPKTVANFIGLAEGTLEFTDAKTGEKVKRPYYDGISFHRVIPNFMAQGGCPTGNGTGGPGFQFADEINADALGLNKAMAVTNGQPHRSLMIRSQQQFQQLVGQLAIQRLGIKDQAELEKRQEELNAAVAKLTLKDVFEGQGYVYNSTRKSHGMDRGTIAMANSGPNTNGSQFFLNMADNHYLNGKHTVFGRITKGMEVVDAMQKVKMGPGDKPLTPIVIESVRTVKPAAK